MKKLTNKKTQELKGLLFTKKGEFKVNTNTVLNDLDKLLNGKQIYTNTTVGSGRRKHYEEDKDALRLIEVCNTLGYKLISGNDSPRGGQLGDFVKVSRKKNEDEIKEIIDFLRSL